MKNYIIIRLVNVGDSQLQTVASDLIDNFKLSPADMLRRNEITISLYELDIYRQPDTTDGRIVTSTYTLANIHDIRKIFSNINKLKFFSWLQDLFNSEIEEEIEEILRLRNDVAHNLLDVEASGSELKTIITKIRGFCMIVYIVSWLNLDTNQKHEKKLETECKQHTNKTLDEFRKIAKKHEFRK